MKIVNQIAGVVGRVLHRDHARSLFAGHVLDHGLIHLGFDIANQQVIEQGLGIRLIQVVPVLCRTGTGLFFPVLALVERRQWQQLTNHGFLAHGVDEFVVHHIEPIQTAFVEGIEHHLDATDQILGFRGIAEAFLGRQQVAAALAEEAAGLAADSREIRANAFLVPATGMVDHRLEQVDVQATGQTAVTGNDDITDALDLALDHVLVPVFRIGLGDVADHPADQFGIGLAGRHAFLSPTHLRRSDHFHGAGDFLRVLDAPDLGFDLFCSCHRGSPDSCRSAGQAGSLTSRDGASRAAYQV